MRQQRAGHVITISSLAGITGLEFVAGYASSKFAVERWMESLRFGRRALLKHDGSLTPLPVPRA